MSFLTCSPTVFAIKNRYEILVNTVCPGQVYIEIGKRKFSSIRAGILLSETTFHKISVPQKILDAACRYKVVFRKTIIKKAYFSEFEEPVSETFDFVPVGDKTKINVYHLADVHGYFEEGKICADFFGDKTDLFIVNGDIAEVETENDLLNTAKFLGDVAKGKTPVVFTRGNHDTRGRLACEFSERFPTENGNHYYTVTIGSFFFIVLDLGEDKADSNPEYGGTNDFRAYRQKETAFLKRLRVPDGKTVIAITHMCPGEIQPPKPPFDIEKETYRVWNEELCRLNVKLMISGHTHETALLKPNQAALPHSYHIIVGSALKDGVLTGAAITLEKEKLSVSFNDSLKNSSDAYEIKF